MKNNTIFITAKEWFESTSLKNPIIGMDHKLSQFFPDCYSVDYDTKLLATKVATKEERQSPFYDDYRERFGTNDIHIFDAAIMDRDARYVFLNGLNQEQFLHIVPK